MSVPLGVAVHRVQTVRVLALSMVNVGQAIPSLALLIGAFEAKTRLSELLDRVARGQTYRITKRGKPVAELRPVASGVRRPRFGRDKGRVVIADDFDAPVPDLAEYSK